MPRITKHFVTVAGRRMHYQRAGEGPVVAMLHASPCSAKILREPQLVFAERFTAIAFDTPGFGLSDKLPLAQPEIQDFADNIALTLSELGIEDAATYGRHTGAAIAVEYAIRHPGRAAMALTDGYPVFPGTTAEDRIRNYLTPIVPSWDGTHLVWLWFRYREQHMFWPWHAKTMAQRADTDVPDLDFLHRGVIDLLDAGDDYRIAYAAAFRHRGLKAIPELTRPVCFGNRPGDSQFKTMKLYPTEAWVQELPRDTAESALIERAILERHVARSRPPSPPACSALAGRTTTDYVDLGNTQVFVRSVGDLRRGAPIVVLPHLPGSSATYDGLVHALGARRPTLALDFPGHGESDPLPGNVQSVGEWSEALRRTLDALGIGTVQFVAHNGSGAVAVEFAARHPDRVKRIVLDSPIALDPAEAQTIAPHYAPDLTPSWDGAHVLRAWHMLRDQEMWWPWFTRKLANARRSEPRIDPDALTFRVREILKQPRSFAPAWTAALTYPLLARLARLETPVALIGSTNDIFAHALDRARAVLPNARCISVEDNAASRASAIFEALA